MIKFQEVSKIFKKGIKGQEFKALDHVSFEINEGEVIGFLGANGAGKTTSIKIMMGLIQESTGQVTFDSTLISNEKRDFSKIGFFPERPYFPAHLTGMEFLYYMGELNNVNQDQIKESGHYWASKLEIDFALNRPLRDYSKGMLQRIGFVSSLLHNPDLLVFDEPLSGLDPVGRKQMKETIKEVGGRGKAVFFSSHILSDVEEVCDKVIILSKGKVIYSGKLKELMSQNEKNNYVLTVEVDRSFKFKTPIIKTLESSYGHQQIWVTRENHQSLIQEIVTSNLNLVELKKESYSLEEIVYSMRSEDD